MLNLFGLGYDESKMKPNLKMAAQRCKIIINKKTIALQTMKKEVAKLLEEKKEEKARIRAEALIREDFTIEALEIVELICDLLHERVKYISASTECPADITEAVNTVIWVADKVDIPELVTVKSQFGWKYGSIFVTTAEENVEGIVNERIVNKLNVRPPSAALIFGYLQGLAAEYCIDWKPCEVGLPNDPRSVLASPAGFSVPMAPGSGLAGAYTSSASLVVPPLTAREETAIRQKIEDLTVQTQSLQDELTLRGTSGGVPSSSIPITGSFPVVAVTTVSITPDAGNAGGAEGRVDSIPKVSPTVSNTTATVPDVTDSENPGNVDTSSPFSFDELEARFAALRK